MRHTLRQKAIYLSPKSDFIIPDIDPISPCTFITHPNILFCWPFLHTEDDQSFWNSLINLWKKFIHLYRQPFFLCLNESFMESHFSDFFPNELLNYFFWRVFKLINGPSLRVLLYSI